jgi:hypothetical protein
MTPSRGCRGPTTSLPRQATADGLRKQHLGDAGSTWRNRTTSGVCRSSTLACHSYLSHLTLGQSLPMSFAGTRRRVTPRLFRHHAVGERRKTPGVRGWSPCGQMSVESWQFPIVRRTRIRGLGIDDLRWMIPGSSGSSVLRQLLGPPSPEPRHFPLMSLRAKHGNLLLVQRHGRRTDGARW